MHYRTRRTVGSYLVVAFALVCVAVLGLVAVTASATYQRVRARTFDMLALAAETGAMSVDPAVAQTMSFLGELATSPDLQSMDPARCRNAVAALATVATSAHLEVLDPSGAQVCTVRSPDAGSQAYEPGPWFAAVQRGETVVEPPAFDPIGRQPGMVHAVPVTATAGGIGAVVAVLYTGHPAVDVPRRMPKETVLIVLDPQRRLVINRSASAPVRLGASTRKTALAHVPGQAAIRDVDGRERYYVETAVGDTGWHVLAGLETSVAMKAADRELRRGLLLGTFALLVIGGLGVLIHRRLARPVKRLGAAIEASWRNESVALAPTSGPREIAQVAEVFNELIIERAAREEDLRHRATHDVLTGLRNRAGIDEALEAAAQVGGSVLYLDLDRFKLVNDSHGHSVGDQLLRHVADRLVRTAGPDAIVARFGGDEFLVVIPTACDEARAASLAERFCDELASAVELDDMRLFLRVSIGIAHARAGVSPETLVRDADNAMYRAKTSGVGWMVYDEGMGMTVRRRLDVENALHAALAHDRLEVHYQPIVDTVTGAVVGAEALLRWTDPDLGPVSPADFIPIAEETGLIVPIGAWVLDQAAGAAARWAAAGRPIPVSVNVAAVQFAADDVAGRVREVLERHGVAPQLLVVEVTESTMINTSEAMSTLTELRSIGVGVALDDFGTGYSSLSYLERMPATELKIDRSFVSRLERDQASRTIVGTLVRLANELGLTVVAEGVETAAQAELLTEVSCNLVQGFLFSRAVPLPAFEDYASSGSTRSHRSPQSSHR